MFHFLDVGVLEDGDLSLRVYDKSPSDAQRSWVPAYHFHMYLRGDPRIAGGIVLRVGNNEYIVKYAGHIGYGVEVAFRGQHLAARACRLLFPLARAHSLNPLWITCNPDNIASRRTCELAGATLVEIVDLPTHLDMYQEGERQKCRYRIDL